MKTSSSLLRPRQHGAATLVVVMVLFLVMALLAAYANRSLLFEQRVAGSYFRSSLSQEVAEAGVEWTLAQLNGAAVDNTCKPVDTAGQRFADKYLLLDPADRGVSARVTNKAQGVVDCARDTLNKGWACRCPAADSVHTARAAAGEDELTPSFGIRLEPGARGGTVAVKVLGCTASVPDSCFGTDGVVTANISKAQLARTSLTVLVGLVSAVRNPPSAPLVVKGDILSTGDGLGLHNADARSAGMLATVGGMWTGIVDARLETVPGAASSQAVVQADPTLLNAGAQDVFKMFMGTSVARYPGHPAARTITCNGDCGAALEAAYIAGQRIVWVAGGLTLSSNKVLGSVSDPLLVVVNGDVILTGPFQLNGMLVSTGGLSWTNTSGMTSLVNGIVLVGGGMQTSGRVDIVYQHTVADHLRNRLGSFVRVPGGWNDSAQ